MKILSQKEYKEINFVKYHSKEYGLIFENDNERNEIILDDVEAKSLAGKMLMLIESKNLKTSHNSQKNQSAKCGCDCHTYHIDKKHCKCKKGCKSEADEIGLAYNYNQFWLCGG